MVLKRAYYLLGARASAARWSATRRLRSLGPGAGGFRPMVAVDSSAPALLISPHLDDVVYSCWSALSGPGTRQVVNVFAGVPRRGFVTRWDRACGARESAAHVRARIAEDAEVLARLGHEPAYLSFIDRQYGARAPTMVEIDAAVAELVPAASAVYAPAGLGFSHGDHLLLREYARAVAASGMKVVLYADLPYAVRAGDWPAWVHGDGAPRPDLADAFWRPALRGVPEIAEVEAVTLRPDVAAAKLDAMRAYRSQFPGLDHDGRLSDPRTHAHEVFWTLTSAADRT
jgi:LmbE family N-acetylglucosaminyl deacetylase